MVPVWNTDKFYDLDFQNRNSGPFWISRPFWIKNLAWTKKTLPIGRFHILFPIKVALHGRVGTTKKLQHAFGFSIWLTGCHHRLFAEVLSNRN
jgi:hypothetical protein